MTKKISSKVVRARSLAIYELEKFIEYVGTLDSELQPDERIVLAAFLLQGLPQLFEQNPVLMDQVKVIAVKMRLKRRHPLN
ncbi:MAG: hypothetical protein V7L00_17850 [Nostoc sp.]|uniref:hypothetical protein n=1 Tax=Nostoc sp. TaxID=1180 RepID=UPI002FF44A70